MDVHCLNCREPWDTYHMRHDAIWDAICDGGLWPDLIGDDADQMKVKLHERWPEQKLIPEVREAFERVGWEFGGSVLVIHRCPCCKNKPANPVSEDTRARVQAVDELLHDDLDGTAAELSET